MIPDPRDDPRYQPDAYISLTPHLYEVIGYERTGSNSGKLHVVNCRTEHPLWLSAKEAQRSILEKAAPAAVTIPDDWAKAA